jgi:hypothetical protein
MIRTTILTIAFALSTAIAAQASPQITPQSQPVLERSQDGCQLEIELTPDMQPEAGAVVTEDGAAIVVENNFVLGVDI